ncbi:MAG: hypothetical protein J2P26_13100, partial [Nocardiopsaceae bacterium]|nr:hypothetical protein [Nocardiopsaceae bacterium]
MTRWSLLRRRRRAQQPGPDAVRPDRIRPEDVRPELEPAVPGGYRPDAPASGGGHAPGAQRAATRRPDASARADA